MSKNSRRLTRARCRRTGSANSSAAASPCGATFSVTRRATCSAVTASRPPAIESGPARMSRWRAALPLVLLLIAGAVLLGSGALDRFHPSRLRAEEGALRGAIAEHPLMSRLAYAGVLTLAIATGVPGTIVIVMAGGLAVCLPPGRRLLRRSLGRGV